jgi:hypothetical protein
MAYQNITGSLSPADIQEIKAAFATIQAKMPFLVTLSACTKTLTLTPVPPFFKGG